MVCKLEERIKLIEEEIINLGGLDRKIEDLQQKISKLARQLSSVKVWHQDHSETEEKLVVSFILIKWVPENLYTFSMAGYIVNVFSGTHFL